MHRFAIYAAFDPHSALHRLASAWLGRDAARDMALAQALPDGIDGKEAPDWARAPARYGFHATLKPPFQLAEGATQPMLHDALMEFAGAQASVSLGALQVKALGDFVALRARDGDAPIRPLADAIVQGFDRFRRPAGAEELARRRRARLTSRQEDYLVRWGYPYVMEEFRLHFSLTGRLDPEARTRAVAALGRYLEPALAAPIVLDALWLFVEPAPGAPLVQSTRYALAAGRAS